MDMQLIVNVIVGTLPVFLMLIIYCIRVEHRLTRLETLMNKGQKDTGHAY